MSTYKRTGSGQVYGPHPETGRKDYFNTDNFGPIFRK